jgi:anti-sigma factor RsiW
MNQEILERLIIDKFSGELTPDAMALLEDWLKHAPGAKKEAARLEQTLKLAQSAFREPGRSTAKPLRFRAPAWALRFAGMAACFIAGIAMGWMIFVRSVTPSPLLTQVRARATDSSFWSQQHLRIGPQTKSISEPSLQWLSPVREPHLIKHL